MKEKIKIMKTGPHVTEDEIRSYMNFDALLRQKDQLQGKQRAVRVARNILIAGVCVLSISALMFIALRGNDHPSPQTSDKTVSFQSVPAPHFSDTLESETIQAPSSPGPGLSREPQREPSGRKKGASTSGQGAVEERDVKSGIPVYVQSEPVKGYPALYEYFERNLVYPETAVKDQVEGVVDVSFVIDTSGHPVEIRVENSLGEAFDEAVIGLIKNMPAWRPATYNGQPVKSRVSLPITFSVKNPK